jgi:signal transduction histidine kinase
MRSLRTRLLALWLMLAVSGSVTALLLIEFYQQSTNTLVSRAEDAVTRACRDLGDRYASFITGWHGGRQSEIDDVLKRELVGVVEATLSRASGIEGGLWQAGNGSLVYAFPTYQGTGPKTDVPAAELPTIGQVNADALRNERPVTIMQTGQSQVLVLHACPLPAPLADVTAWTMTRTFTGQGRAYNQLLIGLAVLGLTVLGSAIWLGRILYSWSRKIASLEASLAGRRTVQTDFPALPPTGERELDRLVDALNATGALLADEHRRATSAERLAAVGRLAAGLAHEIRNPIAAMRLKAENALAGDDDRRTSALKTILEQIGRLDVLLRDLLAMTQQRPVQPTTNDLATFLDRTIVPHLELAASNGVMLETATSNTTPTLLRFDAEQMHRALDNLILNAIENTCPGGTVKVEAGSCDGRITFRVGDTGRGVPEDIREHLFEPFVTGRPGGTGLGLAIVREIVRAHGGDVRVKSDSGGATFEIDVPCRPF